MLEKVSGLFQAREGPPLPGHLSTSHYEMMEFAGKLLGATGLGCCWLARKLAWAPSGLMKKHLEVAGVWEGIAVDSLQNKLVNP